MYAWYLLGYGGVSCVVTDFGQLPPDQLSEAAACYALGVDDARHKATMCRPEMVRKLVAQLLTAPVEAPAVVVPADPNVERAQLIELCGRVSAYEAVYAAIDGAINDPALDTARTYEIIRNALASVCK